MKSVCVYCGSSPGNSPAYLGVARATGRALAARGMTLIYGGGALGLMGAAADACLEAGGKVIGVIPEMLMQREVGHKGLTELHVVTDMHARKSLLAALSDAFITLPGGLGTLEELFEIWTWKQLGYHAKPIGLLNTDGFYDELLRFLNHTHGQGFVKAPQLGYLTVSSSIDELITKLDHES